MSPSSVEIFELQSHAFVYPEEGLSLRPSPRATTTPWMPVSWMKRTFSTSCLGLMMSSTWQATGYPLEP